MVEVMKQSFSISAEHNVTEDVQRALFIFDVKGILEDEK